MAAQEESHETKQGQDEGRHEPRFLGLPCLESQVVTSGQIIGEPHLIRYHLGSHSAAHEYYMKELGVWARCEYPGFPHDPLDAFVRLAHDLSFAGEFMSGDARLLLRASEREKSAIAERDARDLQGYVGDLRTLERMRDAFRSGAYDQVVQLAGTLTLPDKMTMVQRRMVEIANSRRQ